MHAGGQGSTAPPNPLAPIRPLALPASLLAAGCSASPAPARCEPWRSSTAWRAAPAASTPVRVTGPARLHRHQPCGTLLPPAPAHAAPPPASSPSAVCSARGRPSLHPPLRTCCRRPGVPLAERHLRPQHRHPHRRAARRRRHDHRRRRRHRRAVGCAGAGRRGRARAAPHRRARLPLHASSPTAPPDPLLAPSRRRQTPRRSLRRCGSRRRPCCAPWASAMAAAAPQRCTRTMRPHERRAPCCQPPRPRAMTLSALLTAKQESLRGHNGVEASWQGPAGQVSMVQQHQRLKSDRSRPNPSSPTTSIGPRTALRVRQEAPVCL